MTYNVPSIFNDVIGPLMRGPSSSHTAASVRIGKMVRQILNSKPVKMIVEFDINGSLATTHSTQGSDFGLAAGLIGWDITHYGIQDSLTEARKQGIDILFKTGDLNDPHPNTYNISITGEKGNKFFIQAVSVGGGSVEINRINELKVSLKGDSYETILFFNNRKKPELIAKIEVVKKILPEFEDISYDMQSDSGLISVKTLHKPDRKITTNIKQRTKAIYVCQIDPVMPVLYRKDIKVPFSGPKEMFKYNKTGKIDLYNLALLYESQRGKISEKEVFDSMKDLVVQLKRSVTEGLSGTAYQNRILGPQAIKMEQADYDKKLIPLGITNKVICYTIAMMDQKSSMGLIVAAPTAGSCGALPGAILGTAEDMGLKDSEITKAFLAAGLIGVFIAGESTFAAEECGCQAECGSASGMAAAGLVQLMNGTADQALAAASIALQNTMGMICDPVARRVEVPCMGKNVMAAVNALSSANMALAGVDFVIPLDEVIQAMDKAGRMLPYELCCTGLGGLSITPTSKKIENKLNK